MSGSLYSQYYVLCRSFKASSRLRHRRRRPKPPITPPRRAPKRKHDDSAEQTSAQVPDTALAEEQPTPKASKTFHSVEAAALPATPLSSEGKMDSDMDDFNSVASSDAFDDVGSSIGGGKFLLEVRRAGGVERLTWSRRLRCRDRRRLWRRCSIRHTRQGLASKEKVLRG